MFSWCCFIRSPHPVQQPSFQHPDHSDDDGGSSKASGYSSHNMGPSQPPPSDSSNSSKSSTTRHHDADPAALPRCASSGEDPSTTAAWKSYIAEYQSAGTATDSGVSFTLGSQDYSRHGSAPGIPPAHIRSPLSMSGNAHRLGTATANSDGQQQQQQAASSASSPPHCKPLNLSGLPEAGPSPRTAASEKAQDLINQLIKQAHSKQMNASSALYFNTLNQEMRKLLWLGQGGFGIVFQAEWKGAPVAVKFVLSTDEEQLSSNVQEAFVGKMLSHPNVVHTYLCKVLPVEQEWMERVSTGPCNATEMPTTLGVSFTSPSSTRLMSARGEFISSMFRRDGSTVGPHSVMASSSNYDNIRTGNLSNSNSNGASNSIPINPAHDIGCGAPVITLGSGNLSEALTTSMTTIPLLNHHTSAGPTSTTAAHGSSHALLPLPSYPSSAAAPAVPHVAVMTGAATARDLMSMRRNSVASVDNFSIGGSFSYARHYTFMEAIHLLNCSIGQYLTIIVMEHCDRGSLQQAIHRGVFQPGAKWGRGTALRAMVRTARELAQGCCYLHSQNVIHGDLKPGNVLLKSARSDRRGFTARVSDFGFNKNKLLYDECDRASPTLDRASPTLDRNSPQAPVSAQHVATLTHTAPEAVDGQLQKASDVYSFGIIMWEMVSGTPPFADMHWAAMMSCLLSGTLTLEWPVGTNSVIRKLGEACLKYNPAERPDFDTIATVLVKLEQHVKKEKKSKSLTDKLWTAQAGAAAAAAAAASPHPTATASNASTAQPLSTSPGRTSPNHGLLAGGGGYVRERASANNGGAHTYSSGLPSPRSSAGRQAPLTSSRSNRSQSSSMRLGNSAALSNPASSSQRLLATSMSQGRSSSYNGNAGAAESPAEAEAQFRGAGAPQSRHSAQLHPVKTIREAEPEALFARTSSPAAVSGVTGQGPKRRLSQDTQHLQTGDRTSART